MITIDLSGANSEIYDGKVSKIGPNRWRINMNDHEGTHVVARNVYRLVALVPETERDEVLITGIAPSWARHATLSQVLPFFKVVKIFNGKETVTLPPWTHPPAELESDPD